MHCNIEVAGHYDLDSVLKKLLMLSGPLSGTMHVVQFFTPYKRRTGDSINTTINPRRALILLHIPSTCTWLNELKRSVWWNGSLNIAFLFLFITSRQHLPHLLTSIFYSFNKFLFLSIISAILYNHFMCNFISSYMILWNCCTFRILYLSRGRFDIFWFYFSFASWAPLMVSLACRIASWTEIVVSLPCCEIIFILSLSNWSRWIWTKYCLRITVYPKWMLSTCLL